MVWLVEGWTSLDAAIDWIGARYPDQTPEKYGCCGWPQVIHESRRFEICYREKENRRVSLVLRPPEVSSDAYGDVCSQKTSAVEHPITDLIQHIASRHRCSTDLSGWRSR